MFLSCREAVQCFLSLSSLLERLSTHPAFPRGVSLNMQRGVCGNSNHFPYPLGQGAMGPVGQNLVGITDTVIPLPGTSVVPTGVLPTSW